MADNMIFNLFEDYPDIGQGNLFAETVTNAVKKAASRSAEQKSSTNKIEDFGEKIAGARKDAYAVYQNMLRKAAQSEMEVQPLSKSFPKPDYQKLLDIGIEDWKVNAVHALRDFLSPKPNIHSVYLSSWTKKATELRNIAVAVMNDELSREDFDEKLKTTFRLTGDDKFQIHSLIDAYTKLGHDYDFSALTFIEFTNNKIGLSKKDRKNFHYAFLTADSMEELLAKYAVFKAVSNKNKNSERKEKEIHFDVYYYRKNPNEHFIGAKFGKKTVDVEGPFANGYAAKDYLVANRLALEEKFAAMKQIPYERENENLPRTGEEKRSEDITPEKFQETFGFRGVQFGNWVENNRRQEDLNKTYDALMDMVGVLNLPPKSLSLNGQLGLAFGARGIGGKNPPLAHYEHSEVVINLTKNKGAGSLAHEWFHALDNYFSKKTEMGDGMMTDKIKSYTHYEEEQAAQNGFEMLQKTLANTELVKRSAEIDNFKSKTYWSLPHEMAARAFESYIKNKLEERGIRNDFLVNIRSENSWGSVAEKSVVKNDYPYPTKAEVEDVKAAFDYLFDSIRFKSHDENYELYSATTENISEIISDSVLLSQEKLRDEEKLLQTFSQDVFDTELKFFEGDKKLRGRYDSDDDILYVNVNSELPYDWVFYHETFHALKKSEPEIYQDLLNFVESENIITPVQIENYKQDVNQPSMTDAKVREELLADAFADLKTGRRILQEMSDKKPTLANKIINFTKKVIDCAKKFFSDKTVQEKFPSVKLSDSQFL